MTAKHTASFVPQVGLVDHLKFPTYVGHRAAGVIYPEHSLEGYRASVASEFLPEVDVRA